MSRNREVSQLGNFVTIDESSQNNVGIGTTIEYLVAGEYLLVVQKLLILMEFG